MLDNMILLLSLFGCSSLLLIFFPLSSGHWSYILSCASLEASVGWVSTEILKFQNIYVVEHIVLPPSFDLILEGNILKEIFVSSCD